MDPRRPESFDHRTEVLSTGRKYHFVDQWPEGHNEIRYPTLLCVHGFPDVWYGWRYQIGPWVRRGHRVVVPDMLGYGGTEKPKDASEYTTKKLCADLSALLDLLKIEKAVVIGHDWGSFIAARFALWHPDRLCALVLLSVAYSPPSPVYIPLQAIVQRAPNLKYQVYFEDSKSNSEVLQHLRKFLGFVYASRHDHRFTPVGSHGSVVLNQATESPPTILTDNEFDYYYSQLSQDMQGPLNYYRTTKFRYDEEKAAKLPTNLPDDLPVLFIWGTADETAVRSVINKARKFIKHYRDIALEGRSHWLMVEAKQDVTENVTQWLDSLTCFRPRCRANL